MTKQRLERLPEMIEQVSMNQNLRISSAVLNDIIMDAVAINPTPTDKGKRLKIFMLHKSLSNHLHLSFCQ